MKKWTYIICITLTAQLAFGQTIREFPTSLDTEQTNIEWQRDIYRELKINDNAGFTNILPTMMQMVLIQQVPIYEYDINGKEQLTKEAQTDIAGVLRNLGIYYEEQKDTIILDEQDKITDEIEMFYVKESVYYDLANGSFRTQVKALCPVILRDDYLTENLTKYPLFWMNYDELMPYLKDCMVYANNLNKAVTMTANEYFSRNLYKGNIYKVFNTQGLSLSQYYEDEKDYNAEQQRIEKELKQIKSNTYQHRISK